MRRLSISTRPKVKLDLSDIEKEGRPEAITASHLSLTIPPETFDIGKPRASSIYKACMRMHVLGTLSKLKKSERITFGRFITFFIGEAVHKRIQNTPDLLGKNRYGWWRCMACGKRRGFSRVSFERCQHCGASYRAAEYEEHALEIIDPYPCTGHPDMFFKVSNQLRVLEIKTIKTADFKALIAPLIEHVWQVQTYLWGCAEDFNLPASVDSNVGYILYLPKEEVGTYPKMFTVVRDNRILDKVKAKLLTYYEGVTNGQLPECLHSCPPKFTGSVAGYCPCNVQCAKEFRDGR